MENIPPKSAQQSTSPPSDLRTATIGLSLSGGGYRAAVFHLGTLAYLHRIQLLPQLRRLSTVSGGTFVGAKYIFSLIEKKDFVAFFQDFYQFLSQARLIQAGLQELSQGSVRVPSGQRKLITALANVYEATFLKDEFGKAYTLGQMLDADISVQEVIFNAIEFQTGSAFRFQKSVSPLAPIGNRYFSIPKAEARKIRIADIVAASSCFPGGFEPMAFPDDFVWSDDRQVPDAVRQAIQKRQAAFRQPHTKDSQTKDSQTKDSQTKDSPKGSNDSPSDGVIALMDGGIYDNQGTESLFMADDRKRSGKLDLVIISDVDPTNQEIYSYPQRTTPPGLLTIGQLAWLIWFFFIACVLTLGSILYELWCEITQGTFVFQQHFFSALMPLMLAALVSGALWYGWQFFRQVLNDIPQVQFDGWQPLKMLKVNEAIYFVELRLSSVLVLTSSIFMDRIRSLNDRQVYLQPGYQGKLISNRIDRLIRRSVNVPGVSEPTEALQAIIQDAVKMPTTLWFDLEPAKQKAEIEALSIAGQATICFNLMQYIHEQYGEHPAAYPPAIERLWETLQQDWKTLNDTPGSLLDELLQPLSVDRKSR
jgi:hypothetical protein